MIRLKRHHFEKVEFIQFQSRHQPEKLFPLTFDEDFSELALPLHDASYMRHACLLNRVSFYDHSTKHNS